MTQIPVADWETGKKGGNSRPETGKRTPKCLFEPGIPEEKRWSGASSANLCTVTEQCKSKVYLITSIQSISSYSNTLHIMYLHALNYEIHIVDEILYTDHSYHIQPAGRTCIRTIILIYTTSILSLPYTSHSNHHNHASSHNHIPLPTTPNTSKYNRNEKQREVCLRPRSPSKANPYPPGKDCYINNTRRTPVPTTQCPSSLSCLLLGV